MNYYSELNTTTMETAKKFYEETNPFSLQMYFTYMQDMDIRGLLAWTNDESNWTPKTYPADTVKFRLVADCMLRYYYNPFNGSIDGIEWEDADGKPSFESDPEFFEDKAYWEGISADDSPPEYPYMEYEDPDEVAIYEAFKKQQRT